MDPTVTDLPLLIADNPASAFEAAASHLCPPSPAPEPGVHPTAVVAEDAELGRGVAVGAHCVVEPGAVIGDGTVLRPLVFVGREARVGADCVLHPHVAVLDRCVLGDRVILHSGVVVGADGYGYDLQDGRHVKIRQHGIAEIGDDVEVGANATIDRARFGRTLVGEGTKIDNLVMVAHNVVVGPHCLLVSQCGIAGSTTVGHHVTLAAQAGLVGHIEVGDQAIVTAQSGVTNSVAAGKVVFGSPAQEIHRERRSAVLHQKLPEMAARIRELEKTVERLSAKVSRLEAQAADTPDAG
jgi:UDP-3-O-[3-hydroxymyristoyl] glucosamine N-acyltransferase